MAWWERYNKTQQNTQQNQNNQSSWWKRYEPQVKSFSQKDIQSSLSSQQQAPQITPQQPQKKGFFGTIKDMGADLFRGVTKLPARTGVEALNLVSSTVDYASDLVANYFERELRTPLGTSQLTDQQKKKLGLDDNTGNMLADKWANFYDKTLGRGTESFKGFTQRLRETDYIKPTQEWESASLGDKFKPDNIIETVSYVGPGVIASLGAFAISMPLGFTVSAGSVADDVKTSAMENNVDETKAERLGLGAGLLIGAIDRFVPDELFRPQEKATFMKAFSKRLIEMGIMGGKEAGTEIVQENIQIAVESTFREDLGWEEIKTRNAMSAFGGFLGGAGGKMTVDFVNNIRSGDIGGLTESDFEQANVDQEISQQQMEQITEEQPQEPQTFKSADEFITQMDEEIQNRIQQYETEEEFLASFEEDLGKIAQQQVSDTTVQEAPVQTQNIQPLQTDNLNLDPITEQKIQQLNIEDVSNPLTEQLAEQGYQRFYQAVEGDGETDWYFETPEALAEFVRNGTSENTTFRYRDILRTEMVKDPIRENVWRVKGAAEGNPITLTPAPTTVQEGSRLGTETPEIQQAVSLAKFFRDLKAGKIDVSKPTYELKFKRDGYIKFSGEEATPENIAYTFKELQKRATEGLYVVGVKDNKPTYVELISMGTINESLISTFDILPKVVESGVDGVYLIHNHPTGSPQPSEADILASKKVGVALSNTYQKMLGHVVIDGSEFGFITADNEVQIKDMPTKTQTVKKVPVYEKYLKWNTDPKTATITSPAHVVEVIKGVTENWKDVTSIAFLDVRKQIISIEQVDSNITSAQIQELALNRRSTSLILVNPNDTTKQRLPGIKEILKSSNIEVLDAIVPVGESWYSAKQSGLLGEETVSYGNEAETARQRLLEMYRQAKGIAGEQKAPETKQKKVEVPKEKAPVKSAGEQKPSAFAKRMSQQLLELNPEAYGFDPETGKYNQLNLEKDAQKAVSFLEKNPEKSVAVSLGLADPPSGQTANAIAVATMIKAKEESNFELYSEIANSISLRATRMGQEIVTLRGQFNQNSPENYVRRVIDSKMRALSSKLVTEAEEGGKSYKEKVTNKIKKETDKLSKVVQKEQAKIQSAQQIIDSLRC